MTVPGNTEGFRDLESDVAAAKGEFVLFALFMREDVPDRWDLMVSAPWIGDDTQGAVDYLVGEIRSRIGAQALTDLSRIVVVDPNDAAVQALNSALGIEHGGVEVKDSNFFGLQVKHAFIVTSKRPSAPSEA